MRTLDRRKFLTVSAGVGLAVVAAACSSGTAADTEGGTRTVTHKKGTTEVPDNPQRIVTVGYSDQDTLLAFGRQPVGVTDWYGDYPDATWPWAQDALSGTHPEVFNRGQFTGEAVSRTRRTFYVRSPNDPRSRLMTSLGFVVPEQIAQLAADQDAFTISKEQFDIDVLVWNVLSLPYAVEATVPKLADAAAKPA